MNESAINKRIEGIFNNLKETKKVKNVEEFAKNIGYTAASFSYIFSGERNAGKKMIDAIIRYYNVNELYIKDGEKPMFTGEPKETKKQTSKDETEESEDFIINEITERFKEVYESLVTRGELKNQVEFSEKLPYNHSSINNILTGKRNVPASVVLKLCKKFSVSKEFMFEGRLPMFYSSSRLPLYDLEATATNIQIFTADNPEYVKEYIDIPGFKDCNGYISVWGNSMYPDYCAGEIIAVKYIKDKSVIPYGEAFVIVTTEQRMLKYIHPGTNKENWLMVSKNKESFPQFEIEIKKVLHLYLVKGIITKKSM